MTNPDLEAFFALRGAQIAVSKALCVSKQVVNNWRKNGYVPAARAGDFEKFTGIAREKACPDFPWAKPKRAKQKEAA